MKSMNYNVSDLGFLKIPSQFKVLKSKLNFLLLNLKKKYSFSQLDLENFSKNDYKQISSNRKNYVPGNFTTKFFKRDKKNQFNLKRKYNPES